MAAPRPHQPATQSNPDQTGPWSPRTLASAGDSTGPASSLAPIGAAPAPKIPGYEILGILGKGGMGVVYQARQTKLNRLVALKMVLGDRVESKDLIRFLAEAESVAAVRHPHVVQVYEYGDADGRPFLALEYLPGGSLADHLKSRGRMLPEAAAEVVRKLALGIQAVHDHGIVHRDLKPANVLFDETGEPKVADFGLAKRENQTDLTATQAVMGTPAFMAPEQAAGGTKFVGPAADIYSLGVILYVCLTGKRPFEDTDAISLLRKVVDEDPARPRSHVPDLPRDLELICLKCLAKAPHERYSTAQALADDLANFEAGHPVTVRPAGVVERGVKWAKRKPTLAAAYGLTAVSILLVGLVAGAVWLWRGAENAKENETVAKGFAEDQRRLADEKAQLAEEQRIIANSNAKRADEQKGLAEVNAKRADVERTRAERIKYALDTNAAALAWQEGQLTRLESILKSYIPVESSQPDYRTFEWHYLWRQLHSARPRFSTGRLPAMAKFRLSPDGSRLTADGGLQNRVWDLAKGVPLMSFSRALQKDQFDVFIRQPSAALHPDAYLPIPAEELVKFAANEFSRDGKRFYYLGANPTFVRALNLGNGPPSQAWKTQLSEENPRGVNLTLSQRGNLIAVKGFESLHILDASTGVIKWSIPFTAKFRDPAQGNHEFTNDEKELLCINALTRTATVLDAATGGKRRQFDLGSVIPQGKSAISPDSKRLALSLNGGEIRVWNFQTGQLERSIQVGGITQIAFMPQYPHYLVTAGDDGVIRVWDPLFGQPLAVHRGHRTPIKQIAFQLLPPHQLVSQSEDGNVFVWTADEFGYSGLNWTGHAQLGYSPDGARRSGIAVDKRSNGFDNRPNSQKTQIWEWNLASSEVTVRDVGKPTIGAAASCSADFQRIAVGAAGFPVQVLETSTLKEIGAFDKLTGFHPGWGMLVILSPDGKRLAQVVGESDSTELVVWDVDGRNAIRRIPGAKPFGFSGDSSRLVIWNGKPDFGFSVLDLAAGTSSPIIRGTSQFASLSHDGKRLSLAAEDALFAIWNVDEGRVLHKLAGHMAPVEGVAFSPDGRTLASISKDGTLRFWDTETAQQTMSMPVGSNHAFEPRKLAFSPDGRVLAILHSGAAFIDARSTGEVLAKSPQWITINGKKSPILKHSIASQEINSLPETLAQLMETLKKKDAEQKKSVEPNLPGKSVPFAPHSGPVPGLAFNQDGSKLITGDQSNVRIWDVKSGLELMRISSAVVPVVDTQFISRNRIVTTSVREAALRLHSSETGKQSGFLIPSSGGKALQSVFIASSKRLVVFHEQNEGVLSIFDEKDKLEKTLAVLDSKSRFKWMAAKTDGRMICVASAQGATWSGTVWELESGKKSMSWKTNVIYSMAWSGDGKWIASAETEKVATRNPTTGEIEQTFATPAKTQPSGVAASHDGSRIAVVCFNGNVLVWDVKTGKSVASFQLPSTGIGPGRVVFSPDGKRLAASALGVVRIFDLPQTLGSSK